MRQLFVHQRDIQSIIPVIHGTFRQLLSIFSASAGPCVKFSCVRGTFRQLSVRPRDYPSNFVSAEHSVIFSKLHVHPCDLASTFRASAGHSVNFPGHPWDFTSTSVNSQCIRGTMRQIFVCQWDIQSTFRSFVVPSVKLVNSPCICGTFCQLLSTFCASMGPPKTICAAAGPSVNFSQLSVRPWNLPSTFRAAAGLSVNILCGRRTIRQLFLHPRDFLSICGTLSQFFMRLWDCP